MLQIILLVLKIIGIILLCILGLLILAVLMVLFVPVRYRAIVHYHDDLVAKGKISWLLHIISLTVSYENGELQKIIRIFGIKYKKRERKPKKVKKRALAKAESVEQEHELTKAVDMTESNEPTESVNETVQPFKAEQQEKISESEQKNQPKSETEDTADPEEEQKESLLAKWKRFVKMLYKLFHNIQYTIQRIYDKIKQIIGKLEYYTDLIQDEHNQAVLKLLFGQLGVVFGHIKPRKFRMDLSIGTEDPATTGSILAVLGIIYPLFEGGLHVTPYYNESVFETDLDLKGRMTAFVFLRTAWKIYFDKDVKRLLKIMKNGEA